MSRLTPKDRKFYIIVAITLLIMFGFQFLPTFGQVTPTGMKILGIFLGCIFAWCFGELVWSSIIGLVACAILGFGTMGGNFASAYANNTIATIITASVFCFAIEKCGLLGELAKWIVSQRWAQKSIWGLVFAFFLAATVSGALAINAVPPVILMWALFYEVAKEINIKPYTALSTIILCGIGVCVYIGVALMPYGAMTVLVRGCAESIIPNFVFNVGQYMLLNLLVVFIFIPLVVLVLRVFAGKQVQFDMPKREVYKMNLNIESKVSLVVLLLVIVSMIVPNFLATDNVLRVLFNDKLTIVGTFMLASTILMLIRINGKPIIEITEALAKVQWGLVLIVSSALAISGFLTADDVGIVPTIVTLLEPLVAGKSALAVTLIFVVIGLVMTNFINDVVTCVVLYPIAASFVLEAGGSIMLLSILFAQVTIQGCLMPSGSGIAAMFHGNGDWMKSSEIMKWVAIMELVLLVVLLVVSLFGGMIGI